MELVRRQVRRTTRARLGSEGSGTSVGETGLPVVDGLRGDAEAVSHLGLADSSSQEVVGPQSPFLERERIPMLLSPSPHREGIGLPLDKAT